jgi:hypothetical protein
MKSLESIYNSILLENQNPNNIDLKLLKGCIIGKYTINDDGSIDVDGMVRLTNKYLTKIPFKFRNVSGSFWCNSNPLTSLEGAPNSVGGDFYCSDNQLTSLEGAPKTVGGRFCCYNNQLTSLEGAPNRGGGGFYCYINQLTSLEGAPNSVGGVFNCSNNPNLPYSELFKIVDRVRDDIYYSSHRTLEDKDKIRRDRDIKNVLKDDELGSLDV